VSVRNQKQILSFQRDEKKDKGKRGWILLQCLLTRISSSKGTLRWNRVEWNGIKGVITLSLGYCMLEWRKKTRFIPFHVNGKGEKWDAWWNEMKCVPPCSILFQVSTYFKQIKQWNLLWFRSIPYYESNLAEPFPIVELILSFQIVTNRCVSSSTLSSNLR
jgi:hypothetical protein